MDILQKLGSAMSGYTHVAGFPTHDDILREAALEIHRLESEIAAAIPVMREYARENPRWNDFSGGKAVPTVQDPNGVHAWLDRNDNVTPND